VTRARDACGERGDACAGDARAGSRDVTRRLSTRGTVDDSGDDDDAPGDAGCGYCDGGV